LLDLKNEEKPMGDQIRKARRKVAFFLLGCACITALTGQQPAKERAIEEYMNEDYRLAIRFMEEALAESPDDPEIWYYLGVFNHYSAYDSRPLIEAGEHHTAKTLRYLKKAFELNPEYGDARYFYFSECGAAALREYQNNRAAEFRKYYELAYENGTIPEWAIEMGRLILSSCDRDAILFTQGDFAMNICVFTQMHLDFRRDVSIVPLAFLDRPSIVLALEQNHVSDYLRGVKTGLSREHILSIHPYKWKPVDICIPVPEMISKKYSLSKDYTFKYHVEPDLLSRRIVSKIEGEEPSPRTYLSPHKAILLSILEANGWTRPVFFTKTFESVYLDGITPYLQDCGLVSRLIPVQVKETGLGLDVETLEQLVLLEDLSLYSTIKFSDQPRASAITRLLHSSFVTLANYYHKTGRQSEIEGITNRYNRFLKIGFDTEVESSVKDYFEILVHEKK
jgi:tetratricopeptide (TPR) repeat protein